jgi:transcriptional regulator with XRE-family HTH domain
MFRRQWFVETSIVSLKLIHLMYQSGMRKVSERGHYLREWREHRGLSLARLAQRMEVEPGEELISSVSIGRIERGVQPYSQPILEAIAVALDVSTFDLLAVNPKVDGKVIDLLNIIRSLDNSRLEMATKMLKAIA